MAQTISNALQNKANPLSIPPLKMGTQSTTPQYSIGKPNTPVNITYGGKQTVPSGQYGSTNTMPKVTTPLNFSPKVAPSTPQAGIVKTSTSNTNTGVNPYAGLLDQLNKIKTGLADYQSQQNKSTSQPVDNRTDYAKAIEKLTTEAEANKAIGQQYQDIGNKAGQQIADIGQQSALNVGGYRTTGFGPSSEGNAQIIAQTAAQRQQAIAQGAQAQMQGLAGQLSAQGQLQSALTGAMGAQAPQQQFGVLTSPTTGQPVMGGTPQQAAFAGGQVGASLGLGGDYQKNQGYINQGTTQINALNDLVSSSGVNINNAPAMNNLLKTWSTLGASDPRYQKLQSILSGINASYSQVLGTAIDVQQLAGQQNKGIMDVIKDLDQRARAANEALKNTGTGQTPTLPTSNQQGGIAQFNPDGSMSF